MSGDPIRVLIADDHAVVREGVRAMLETVPEMRVVAETASGEETVAQAAALEPDVVLLDLIMPLRAGAPVPRAGHGAETARRIKASSPATAIVVLSSFDDDDVLFPVLEAGALSYLLKDASPAELVTAVRRAARGQSVLHPRVASRLVRRLHGERPVAVEPLSERELEVLRAVADGLSNHDVAARLSISEKTVKSHVSNILGKLGLRDRTQAAIYAWREGLAGPGAERPRR